MNYLQALESNQDKLEGSAFVKAPREFSLKVNSKGNENDGEDEESSNKKRTVVYSKPKVYKEFKPSKNYLEAKDIMINLCLPSSEFDEEFLNEIQFVFRPEGKIIKLDLTDDMIKINEDDKQFFSKQKFLDSRFFQRELEEVYSKRYNCNIKTKFIKPKEDSKEWKILVKPYFRN